MKPRAGKTLSRERPRRDVRRLIKKIFAEMCAARDNSRVVVVFACSRDVLVKRERFLISN